MDGGKQDENVGERGEERIRGGGVATETDVYGAHIPLLLLPLLFSALLFSPLLPRGTLFLHSAAGRALCILQLLYYPTGNHWRGAALIFGVVCNAPTFIYFFIQITSSNTDSSVFIINLA